MRLRTAGTRRCGFVGNFMISNYTYNKRIMTYFSAPDAQLYRRYMGLGYKISSSDLEKKIQPQSNPLVAAHMKSEHGGLQ